LTQGKLSSIFFIKTLFSFKDMSTDGNEESDRAESDSQQNRWPSILSLLSGSRQQNDKTDEAGKIDDELSW
jgi:hypothetical protein